MQVKLEFEHLRNMFADAATLLDGHESNADVLLVGASTTPWLHFACHGFLNVETRYNHTLPCTAEIYQWKRFWQVLPPHTVNWHFWLPVIVARESLN